jgi:hypothetical protein
VVCHLLLARSRNDLGIYATADLARAPPAAPLLPLGVLALPTASPAVHACCSTVRLLDCPAGMRPFAPDMLYLALRDGSAVSCPWPALLQCALGAGSKYKRPSMRCLLRCETKPCGCTGTHAPF